MNLSGLLKGGTVAPPPADVGGVAPVRSSAVPKVTLVVAPDEEPIAAWYCEIPYARARLDFLNVSCDAPVTILFRLLACVTCDTDTGIEVTKGTLTVGTATSGQDFAGVVAGGVPGTYWVITARVVGGTVKLTPVLWFDRLGTEFKAYGDKVTP